MALRPDERAAEAEIERSQNFNKNIKRGITTATAIGTAAIGGGIGARILPFLNEYIPTDLAMKGISKISPKIGQFLKNGQSMGLDVKEGLDFIKNKLNSQESQTQNAKDNRNIIEQYSPELHQFISEEVKKGRSPLEAGALAQLEEKFKKSIKKIEKDHKAPFSSILESTYGGGQKGGTVNSPSQGRQPFQGPGINQQTQQMQQGQPQPGQGQAALMSILQKLQQARGAQ